MIDFLLVSIIVIFAGLSGLVLILCHPSFLWMKLLKCSSQPMLKQSMTIVQLLLFGVPTLLVDLLKTDITQKWC